MALKKCKECGNQVSSKAKTCPSCGAPVKQEVTAVSGFLSLVVIALVVWGVMYGINELEEWSPNEEQRRAEIEAAKTPEQREREAERAEYDRLKSGAYSRDTQIAEAQWWLTRKRQRLNEARAPGSGQDVAAAREDYEKAQAQVSKLHSDEGRYQELRRQFEAESAIANLASTSKQKQLDALDQLAALSERVPTEAFEPLKKLATHEDATIRWKAVFVLGEMPSRTVDRIPILVQALNDEEALVRQWAAIALGTIASKSPDALTPHVIQLAGLVSDSSTPVPTQGAILCLIGDMGASASDAIPVLRQVADAPDGSEAIHAAIALVLQHLEEPMSPVEWAERKLRITVDITRSQ